MSRRAGVPGAVAIVVTACAFGILALGLGEGDGGDASWSDPGRRVFAAMGCGSCHRLEEAGSTGRLGPSLDGVLSGHDRRSLARSIVGPSAGGGFSAMPDDYGERMTQAELASLIDFLLAAR